MSKLIIGCGYLGLRVAKAWQMSGEEVFAVTRSKGNAKQFSELGLSPIIADVTDVQTLSQLPTSETILYAVGFDRSADKSMEEVYVNGLQNVLEKLDLDSLNKFIYISSTGVYGNADGDEITEQSPCNPSRENGKICLKAETLLQQHPQLKDKVIILRLAGIYGPERVPHQKYLQSGEPIQTASDGYLNLIHVDDAVQIVRSIDEKITPPELFLVSDGHPVQRKEYIEEIARQLNAPIPNLIAPEPSSPVAQRATSSKKIQNQHLMKAINIDLQYPTYREGLTAILGK